MVCCCKTGGEILLIFLSMARKFEPLTVISIVLMACLALTTFVVSYNSLYGLALVSGVTSDIAWLWPFSIDGLLVLSAVVRMKYSLDGKSHLPSSVILGCATLMSIGLNVVHAPSNVVSQIVFAIPPATLFISSEISMSMLQEVVETKIKLAASRKRAAARAKSRK